MSHVIPSRKDLPVKLVELGLIGEGVEVGVYQGSFSLWILNNWPGTLHLVDPWQHQAGVCLDRSNVLQTEHDIAYEKCKQNIAPFKKRVQIHRMFSVEAAKKFEDKTLDFVYLDARHDYRSVFADITAWYPKVRSGGIISGHDYFNKCVRKNLVEVKRAVDNFFLQKEQVFSTLEKTLNSWYAYKH